MSFMQAYRLEAVARRLGAILGNLLASKEKLFELRAQDGPVSAHTQKVRIAGVGEVSPKRRKGECSNSHGRVALVGSRH